MEKRKLLKITLAVFLICFSVFTWISMVTYYPTDPPFADYPQKGGIKNYCGRLGAELSGYGLSGLGIGAYILTTLIGAWGGILLWRGRVEDLWVKAIGGILLILSLTVVFGLLGPFKPLAGGISLAGGVLGTAAAGKLLEHLGLAGTCVFLTFGFLTSSVLLFNLSPSEAVLLLSKKAKKRAKEAIPEESSNSTGEVVAEPSGEVTTRSSSEPLLLPIELLDEPTKRQDDQDEESLSRNREILEGTLAQFNIIAQVVGFEKGPAITMYELELAPGTKVSKVISLSDDLAIALKAPSIRVVAPLTGRSTVGIEVPNRSRMVVRLRELLEILQEGKIDLGDNAIPLPLGRDITGYPIFWDLSVMPHLLIAGTTGSGKSVCLNSLILSILFLRSRRDVKLLLVDPKLVEFSAFKDIPHLISPVVTDVKEAQAVLEWAVKKMDERYGLLARAGVKNVTEYNKLGEEGLKRMLGPSGSADPEARHLPHIVIIIDELADLMMVASKKVEDSIIRLSQKSRAVGIHLIVSTQRPSVDVVTGLIKSNLPARISFHVASKVDSRTVLDQNGAEKLLGGGDMLFIPPGTTELLRVQGTYTSDGEVKRVVEFLKRQAPPEFSSELRQWKLQARREEKEDPLYQEAVRVVLKARRCSEKFLQEELRVSYPQAVRLLDQMVEDGIIGEYKGLEHREVLLNLEDWEPQRQEGGKEKVRG